MSHRNEGECGAIWLHCASAGDKIQFPPQLLSKLQSLLPQDSRGAPLDWAFIRPSGSRFVGFSLRAIGRFLHHKKV